MTTLLVAADTHSGVRIGLTPPDWQFEKAPGYDQQKELWDWYIETVNQIKPDVALWNGDMVDGNQSKCGARGLITADPAEQASMAVRCVREAGAKQNLFTVGTAYHTGKEGDWERLVSNEFAEELHDRLFFKVEDVVIDARHFIGRSSVPYGRATTITKENVWNIIRSEAGWQPRAKVFIRSHVHYFVFSGDAHSLAMTTPALQLPGGLHGDRLCTGTVDAGLMWLMIDGDQFEVKWRLFGPTEKTRAQLLEVKV
jgi:hypothetical protein